MANDEGGGNVVGSGGTPAPVRGGGVTAPKPAPKPAAKPAAPSSGSSSSTGGMLRIGSTGSAVKALQQKLGITADGIFGAQTQQAVMAYQRAHGLTPDGIAGPQTLGSLGLGGGGGGGGGGSTSPTGTSSAASTLTPEERAANFGWSLAVINSNPELKQIFSDAVKHNYTTQMFVARVRDTTWFKTHTDTWRQAYILQKSDPATWTNRLNAAIASLTTNAAKMGANLTATQLRQMATDQLMFGWTTDQVNAHLSTAITIDNSGNYKGEAGAAQYRFTSMAGAYGVAISPVTMGQWVKQAAAGNLSDDSVREYLVSQAASRYPALSERLRAGETMDQIADPYKQSYAKILEVNPDTVKLSDPLLQQAFAAKDAQGKPAVQTVWQFEQNLRNDPRWTKTDNARDNMMAVAHGVLKDMGVAS